MTQIDFHTGLSDWIAYACALLRKALKSDAQVLVVADTADLAVLSEALWVFSATDFLAHEWVHDQRGGVQPGAPIPTAWRGLEASPAFAASTSATATPLVLSSSANAVAHADVLVHIGHVNTQPVAGFERFSRLIELIPDLPDRTAAARLRWKYVQDRGYPLKNHAVKKKGE